MVLILLPILFPPQQSYLSIGTWTVAVRKFQGSIDALKASPSPDLRDHHVFKGELLQTLMRYVIFNADLRCIVN